MKNFKPSQEFDKKYGTVTFEKYKFPNNKTANQVWNADKLEMRELAKKLTHEHFPPMEDIKLGIVLKRIILRGMASGFNMSDIYYFAILGIYASHSMHTNLKNVFFSELKKSQGEEKAKNVMQDIQWVISLPTAMTILAKFDNKFNATLFIKEVERLRRVKKNIN
jgi:hypothetical protein